MGIVMTLSETSSPGVASNARGEHHAACAFRRNRFHSSRLISSARQVSLIAWRAAEAAPEAMKFAAEAVALGTME